MMHLDQTHMSENIRRIILLGTFAQYSNTKESQVLPSWETEEIICLRVRW